MTTGTRDSKRQRDRESHSHSNDSINQSAESVSKRSNTSHSVTHDLLISLGPDVFNVICSFLSVRTKMSRVLMLNKSINQSFDPYLRCQNENLTITRPMCAAFNQANVMSLLRVARIASDATLNISSTDFDHHLIRKESITHSVSSPGDADDFNIEEALDLPPGDDPADLTDGPLVLLFQVLAELMTNNQLKSLALTENVDGYQMNSVVIDFLMKQLKAIDQPITLSTLALETSVGGTEIRALHLGPCLNPSSLHTLKLSLDGTDMEEESIGHHMVMFDSLPANLTWVEITCGRGLFGMGHEEYDTLFTGHLSDNTWLPHIRHLDLGGHHTLTDTMFTIMQATGQPRPYERLGLTLSDDFDEITLLQSVKEINTQIVDYFQHLTCLDIDQQRCWLHSVAQFGDLDHHLPQLKFSFYMGPSDYDYDEDFAEPCDLEPLFVFLSQRPIERLKIQLCADRKEEFVSLSDIGMQALSSMKSLKALTLWVTTSCEVGYIYHLLKHANLIEEGAWPCMTHLFLDFAADPQVIEKLLLACTPLTVIE